MKNKINPLVIITTFLFANVAIANESGDINISLTAGSDTNDAEITGSLVDDANIELTFNDSIGEVIENNNIGNIKFTGLNLEYNYMCSVRFESDYLNSQGAFELREAGYTEMNLDAIPYRLSAYGVTTISTGTIPVSQQSLRPNEVLTAEANAGGDCIVDLTMLGITHWGVALPGKDGNYTGTLTYTLSFDVAGSV